MPKWITAYITCLLMALCASSFAEDAAAPKEITWHKSYDAALAAAKDSGKLLMVDFATDWCGFCKKLDAETYTNDKVIAQSVQFECARVDGDKQAELTAKFGVKGFPTIVFLTSEGKEVLRNVGFATAPVFLAKMKQAQENQKLVAQLPDLQAKVDADPKDAASSAQLGHIYVVLEQTDKALPLLNKVVDLDKDGKLGLLTDAKLDMAICEMQGENPATSDHLNTWLTANPAHTRATEARFYLGLSQAIAGQMQPALTNFEAVIAAAPDSIYGAMSSYYAEIIRQQSQPRQGG